MKKLHIYITLFLLLLMPGSLWATYPKGSKYAEIKTVDPQATRQTKALYANLKLMAKDHILFGHQDALAYGVKWSEWHKSRSDVKDVCGSHPAVFGWEMSKLGKSHQNIDSVNFDQMKGWIKEVYKMGGINEMSFHMDNFVNGGSSWDVGDRVVATILPGGENHEAYLAKLDALAEFISDLKKGFVFRKDIPIIFRPFHEHTGSWFWWGKDWCTPEEYKSLWRFTVHYLRDEKNLHNLLWAYSPDIFQDKEEYLERYPGDEYVDILGADDYHDLSADGDPTDLTRRLRMLVEMAEARDKVAALTETGFESIPNESWWTDVLLAHIKSDSVASRIAWLMVWRNDRPDHHYAPFPDHISAANFIQFRQDEAIIFEEQLPNIYRLK